MQTFGISDVVIIFQQCVDLALCIFGFGKFRRNINLPMREFFIQRLDPFGDARFTRVDLLTATDKTNDRCPVFTLIERPNKERRFGYREVWHFQFVPVCSTTLEIIRKTPMRP